MRLPHPLPTEDSPAGAFARMLAQLYGPAIQPADGTRIAAELLALGGALADGRETNLAAIAEAFVGTASQLLTELEAQYGLVARPDLPDADRQARLLAKVRAARGGSPGAILAAVRVYDPTAELVENTPATVAQTEDAPGLPGDDRLVFHFGVLIAASVFDDAAAREAIRKLVEQMKPAHATFEVCVQGPLRFDDPGSGFDRNPFGV